VTKTTSRARLACAAAVSCLPLAASLAAPPPHRAPRVLASSRITLSFDSLPGAATTDGNRIDAASWVNSAGTLVTGLAATEGSGSNGNCNDPYEYFGEAEGYPDEAQAPLMVTSGERASWTATGAEAATTKTSSKTCAGVVTSGNTTTAYTLSDSADLVNAVQVVRTFKFAKHLGMLGNNGLRAYMARLPISPYHYTLVPDTAGNVQTYDANNCASPCTVTDWNGSWLADDDGTGNGMAIVRASSSTAPAFVGVDSDGYSNSNVSSVVLAQPANGWTKTVVETEYLCFYDPTSWPSSAQAAGQLPAGCTVP
jgi:hypothetical protein